MAIAEQEPDLLESQANALAKLPKELAVIKMEQDSIMAVAAAHKRDHAEIVKELDSQLAAYPSLADTAIYNKPVGQVITVTCKCGKEYESPPPGKYRKLSNCPTCGMADPAKMSRPRMKFARGLSIRAAETLKQLWGFCGLDVEMEVLDDGNVRLVCTWIDYQTGSRHREPRIVSKFYKSAGGGGMQSISDDRFYSTTVGAEKSKLIREVINRNLPAGLKMHFEEAADKIIDGRMTESAAEKIVGFFATKGVSLEQIESAIGRTKKAGWLLEDRKTIAGLWNAVEQGELTISEAFPADDAPADKSKPTGPVSGSDLTKAPTDTGRPSDESASRAKSAVEQKLKPAESRNSPAETAEQSSGPDPLADYITSLDSTDSMIDCDKLMGHAYAAGLPKDQLDRLTRMIGKRKAQIRGQGKK